ncbi:hypothetical protein FRC11_008122 [Ceratobasidium sp. 423]|nr:hypothetical protein FRC11_008122 [Ceratobasidium sp. 423]
MQSFAQISTRPTLVSQLSPSRLPGHSLFPPTLRTAGMASRSGTQASPPPKKMAYFPKIEAQAADSPVPVDGEIGEEVHTVDQHLIFTGGSAKAIVAGEEKAVKEGDLVVVPAGTKHNFINTAKTPLVLYTVYAPAEHATMSVHKSSKEGEKLEGAGKDEPPAWSQGGGK